MQLVHSDDFINEIADRVVEYQERERDCSALKALEARQRDNEKAIANMLAAIEAGIITPSTKSRLMELEAERTNIDKGIARELIADSTLDRDQIVFFLERFRKGDPNDEAYRIMLVDTFLNSVFLYDDDKMVLVLNYSGEHSRITLSAVEKAINGGGAECSSIAPPTAPAAYFGRGCYGFAHIPNHNHEQIFCFKGWQRYAKNGLSEQQQRLYRTGRR